MEKYFKNNLSICNKEQFISVAKTNYKSAFYKWKKNKKQTNKQENAHIKNVSEEVSNHI